MVNAVIFTQNEGKVIALAKVISRANFEAACSLNKARKHGGETSPESESGLSDVNTSRLPSRFMRCVIVNPWQSCGSVDHPGASLAKRSSTVDNDKSDDQGML